MRRHLPVTTACPENAEGKTSQDHEKVDVMIKRVDGILYYYRRFYQPINRVLSSHRPRCHSIPSRPSQAQHPSNLPLAFKLLLYPTPASTAVCVCFIIRPFFLPGDNQHIQCPCRFFSPRYIRALWSLQNHATEILEVTCYAVGRGDNAMPCHRTGYDKHDIHIL